MIHVPLVRSQSNGQPFDGVSELGRTEIDGVMVAARDQVILDAHGGIDRMAEQADILLGRRLM